MNTFEQLRQADPAADIADGPLDMRARTDLNRVMAAAAARQAVPRRRLALAAAAVAAVAVGLVVSDLGPGATPAYAVVLNDDGTVSVTIDRWEDADGLEAAIEKYGINAEVDYLLSGKTCQQGRFTIAPTADQQAAVSVGEGSTNSIVLRPDEFGADETLVIEHSSNSSQGALVVSALQVVAKGPVAACRPEENVPTRSPSSPAPSATVGSAPQPGATPHE